jgi:hypothetical protein
MEPGTPLNQESKQNITEDTVESRIEANDIDRGTTPTVHLGTSVLFSVEACTRPFWQGVSAN